jgi:hypothetical protein
MKKKDSVHELSITLKETRSNVCKEIRFLKHFHAFFGDAESDRNCEREQFPKRYLALKHQ